MSSADKITGKAKEVAGKVRGDEELEAEGKAQQLKGKVGEAADDAKDRARGFAKGLGGDDER